MTGTSDAELINFLADPDNLNKFIGVATTQSLGYGLTDEGEWVKLDS
jgi:hypothetical protein